MPKFELKQPTLDEIHGQPKVEDLKRLIDLPPVMLFTGTPGCGKTVTAYALAMKHGYKVNEINASDDRGIGVIRGKFKTLLIASGKKVILMDEADSLTEDAQEAMRRQMEQLQLRPNTQTRLILTANYEYNLIPPILSRCVIYRFQRVMDKNAMLQIILTQLQKNSITLDMSTPEKTHNLQQALGELITYGQGDVRRVLVFLQNLFMQGKELTYENVVALRPPSMASELLSMVTYDRIQDAIALIEKMVILSPSIQDLILDISHNLWTSAFNEDEKRILQVKLREIEVAVKGMGLDPIMQLTSFVCFMQLLKVGKA